MQELLPRIDLPLKPAEFAQFRLRYKLGLAGLVAILLMLLIGAIGVSSLRRIDEQIKSNVYRRTLIATTASDLLRYTQEASTLVFTMLAAVDSRETVRMEAELRRNRVLATKKLAELDALSTEARERDLLTKVKLAQERADVVITEMLTRADQDLANPGNRFAFNQQILIQLIAVPSFQPLQKLSLAATSDYLDYQRQMMERSYAEADQQSSQILGSLIAVVLLSAGAGALTLFMVGKSVERPLAVATKAAKAIAAGDFAHDWEVAAPSRDEIGQLIEALHNMQSRLQIQMAMLEADIQQKERSRIELTDQNAELLRLNAQLSATQAQLVQSEKLAALGALVAGVAHELNTPIGNGLTVASTIEDSSHEFHKRLKEGISRSQLEQFVHATMEGGQLVRICLERAADLVQSFKQVAVDRANAHRRRFDLEEILREAQLTLSPLIKRTPHSFTLEIHEPIWMDSFPGPLGQVIYNLFTNALLHGFEFKETGAIRLAANKAGERVILEFTDNGSGIAEKNLKHIFEPFFTTKLGQGGSGLGLHIVHNIVTAVLGGEITVSSTEGEGTRFTLDLPIEAPRGETLPG